MAQVESLAITVHDYMAMPDGPPYHQLIEGDLHTSPSPSWRHQKIARNIQRILERHLDDPDDGELFQAPMDVILGETNVYQPDLLFFRRKSKAKLGDHCVEGAPDFVVEILSDSTAHLDRDIKRKIYARSGVHELWLIDPEAKTIQIFNLQNAANTPAGVHAKSDTFTSHTFPNLTFSCSEIFRGA